VDLLEEYEEDVLLSQAVNAEDRVRELVQQRQPHVGFQNRAYGFFVAAVLAGEPRALSAEETLRLQQDNNARAEIEVKLQNLQPDITRKYYLFERTSDLYTVARLQAAVRSLLKHITHYCPRAPIRDHVLQEPSAVALRIASLEKLLGLAPSCEVPLLPADEISTAVSTSCSSSADTNQALSVEGRIAELHRLSSQLERRRAKLIKDIDRLQTEAFGSVSDANRRSGIDTTPVLVRLAAAPNDPLDPDWEHLVSSVPLSKYLDSLLCIDTVRLCHKARDRIQQLQEKLFQHEQLLLQQCEPPDEPLLLSTHPASETSNRMNGSSDSAESTGAGIEAVLQHKREEVSAARKDSINKQKRLEYVCVSLGAPKQNVARAPVSVSTAVASCDELRLALPPCSERGALGIPLTTSASIAPVHQDVRSSSTGSAPPVAISSEPSCSICFQSMSGRSPCILECGHKFCTECLTAWMKRSRRRGPWDCPQCRCKFERSQIWVIGAESKSGDATGDVASMNVMSSVLSSVDVSPSTTAVSNLPLDETTIDIDASNANSSQTTVPMDVDGLQTSASSYSAHCESGAALAAMPGTGNIYPLEDVAGVPIVGQGDFGTKAEMLVRYLLLLRTREPDAKSLVFSQFDAMLDVLARALQRNTVPFVHLKGDKHQRARKLARFSSDPAASVLLLSLRTDNAGMTLVAATHVFLTEPSVNAAIEEQAINRVFRIGQTRRTFVHKFVMKNSVEEWLCRRQKSGAVRVTASSSTKAGDIAGGSSFENVQGQQTIGGKLSDSAISVALTQRASEFVSLQDVLSFLELDLPSTV